MKTIIALILFLSATSVWANDWVYLGGNFRGMPFAKVEVNIHEYTTRNGEPGFLVRANGKLYWIYTIYCEKTYEGYRLFTVETEYSIGPNLYRGIPSSFSGGDILPGSLEAKLADIICKGQPQ